MPAACARPTQSSSALRLPKRDGLMLSWRSAKPSHSGPQTAATRSVIASTSCPGVDGRVEAEPALLPAQRLARGTLQRRVLEHRAGERLAHQPVLHRVRRIVHGRALVERLEVQSADAAGRGDLLHEALVPLRRRVELELERRVHREPRLDVETRAEHEADGTVGTPQSVAQAQLALAQGEVERGALEAPAPVGAEELLLGRPAGEQVQAAQVPREPVERPLPGQRQLRRVVVVVLGRVGDVLSAALEPAADQHDLRGHAAEPAGDVQLVPLGPVAVDVQEQARRLARTPSRELRGSQRLPSVGRSCGASTLPDAKTTGRRSRR